MSLATSTVTVTVLTACRTALLTSSETTNDAHSHAVEPHSPTATEAALLENRTRDTVGANANVITVDRSEFVTARP